MIHSERHSAGPAMNRESCRSCRHFNANRKPPCALDYLVGVATGARDCMDFDLAPKSKRPRKTYANLADVLPPDLFAKVETYYHGCCFIPSMKRAKTEAAVLAEADSGARSIREIVRKTGASRNTVRRVLRDNDRSVGG